ncbi:hypothetical protein ACI2OX_01780 [Bacillus sp. N9]
MKRFLAIFTSLALIVGILAACGSSGSSEGSKSGGGLKVQLQSSSIHMEQKMGMLGTEQSKLLKKSMKILK